VGHFILDASIIIGYI